MRSEGKCRLLTARCSSGLGLLAEGWHQFGPSVRYCSVVLSDERLHNSREESSDPSVPDSDCLQQSKSQAKMRTFHKFKELQWNVYTKE